jgi:hypothetical protein
VAGVCAVWLWHKIAAFFQTWYGTVAGTIGILATIYNGIPQMLKTWDFIIDRFRDQPVLEVLHEVRLPQKLAPFNPAGSGQVSPTIVAIAKHGSYSVGDLADILNRSHQSIGKSIRRLRVQGRIEQCGGGFRLKK